MQKKISALLLLALVGMPALAQKPSTKAQVQAQTPKAKKDGATIDRKGLFSVKKVGEDWFFEIPDSILNKEILAVVRVTSAPTGASRYGGEQANKQVVYWQIVDDKTMVLRSRILDNYADKRDIVSKAVALSSEDPIAASFRIEETKKGVHKIKVTSFLLSDNPLFSLYSSYKEKDQLMALVPDASYIKDITTYPINTEVKLVKTWTSRNQRISSVASTGRATYGLNISFLKLPEEPMQMRLFDPRVGYFSNGYTEFSDYQQTVDQVRFITRWRLEPKEEDIEKMKRGELVEPKKPIVYYVDPATPKKYVKYLIAGVNDWQKAFEQAGFKNAIIGKEWPENDSTMSLEDARYSVIRYLASSVENAYGPNVHDPRSGEILESHIGWYHNITSLLHSWYFTQASQVDSAAAKMRFDDELMGELVRFVSSHEVGHTLGLRHNFGSSSTVPVEKLRDAEWLKANGHTPSIMDYARFNYVAQPEDGVTREGLFPRIGDYDRWAIEWGYKPTFDTYDGISDRWAREQMVQDSLRNNPRLWFGDGETGRVGDPRNLTEDLSDNVMIANDYGIKNLKRIIKNIPHLTYEYSDIYNTNSTKLWTDVLGQFTRYINHVRRHIGFWYDDFQIAGSTSVRYRPVPKAKQKEAIAFLDKHVFNEPTWLISEPYISQIAPNPEVRVQGLGTNLVSALVDNSALKSLNTAYPANEYLEDLTTLLFADNASPSLSAYRRALQQTFVNGLIKSYKEAGANDLRVYLRGALIRIEKQTRAASNGTSIVNLHNKEIAESIKQTLEPK